MYHRLEFNGKSYFYFYNIFDKILISIYIYFLIFFSKKEIFDISVLYGDNNYCILYMSYDASCKC